MSIRRHRTLPLTVGRASVLLSFACASLGIWAILPVLGDSDTNSPSQPVTSPGEPKIPANRAANRPRPAFWQGDTSLSDEQKATLRALTQSYRQENKSQLEAQIQIKRELEELVFAIAPDTTAIQAKAAELAKVEGQLAVSRAQLIQKLRPKLSPEQLERLKSLRGAFELSERFAPVPSPTNRNTLPQRPRKRSPEPDASGSAKPKE